MSNLVAAWLLMLVLASPVRAAGDTGPVRAKSAPRLLTLTFGLERRHDDNVLRLRQSDLDRFAANPASSRFRITAPADNETVVRGSLRWRIRPLPHRETALRLSASAYEFDRNPVKDWQEYSVSLAQELTASRHNLTRLELWCALTPHYYLGETTDSDASIAAQRRIRRSLTYSKTTIGAELAQELLRGRLEVAAGLERVHRNYNVFFDERDNDNDRWRLETQFLPWRGAGPALGLTYIVGALHARGDLAGTPITDTDISYNHHGLGASLTVPWSLHGRRGDISLWWMPEARAYTTADKYDVSRFGRVTHRQERGARMTQHLWGPLDLLASVSRLTTDATFPPGVEFSPDDTDVDQTVAGAALRARWQIPKR